MICVLCILLLERGHLQLCGTVNNFVTEQNKLKEDRLSWLNKLQFSCSSKCKKLFHYKLNSWNGCLLRIVYGLSQELIEKLSKDELPKEEYQCMNEPSQMANESKRGSQSVSARTNQPSSHPHSMRSRRTATWAKPSHSDDGYSRCFNSDFSHLP